MNLPDPKLSLAATIERTLRAQHGHPPQATALKVVEELTALNVLDLKSLQYRDDLVALYTKLTTSREIGILDFDRIKQMLAQDLSATGLPDAIVLEVETAWKNGDHDRAVETLVTAAFPHWKVYQTRKLNPLTEPAKATRLHQAEFTAYVGDNGTEPYIGATVKAERAYLGILAAALCVLYFVYYPEASDQLQDLADDGRPAPAPVENLFGAASSTDEPQEEMAPGTPSLSERARAAGGR